jgi:hypothetical protein
MKFLQYLNEAYFGLFVWQRIDYGGKKPITSGPPDFPVFINPDRKEMMEAHGSKWSRFYLDIKNNNLCVWDWNVLHGTMSSWLKKQEINNDYPSNSLDQSIWGTSGIEGGVFKTVDIERSKNQKGFAYIISDHTIDLLSKWYDKDSIYSCLKKPEPKKRKI